MATMPMQTDPAAQGDKPDDDSGQIAELCIAVMQDGSLQVYKEQGEDPNETESPRQNAANIGEALKLVLGMYRDLGQGDEQDQLTAGYSGGRGA